MPPCPARSDWSVARPKLKRHTRFHPGVKPRGKCLAYASCTTAQPPPARIGARAKAGAEQIRSRQTRARSQSHPRNTPKNNRKKATFCYYIRPVGYAGRWPAAPTFKGMWAILHFDWFSCSAVQTRASSSAHDAHVKSSVMIGPNLWESSSERARARVKPFPEKFQHPASRHTPRVLIGP